jgi:hypothetical protein
MAAASNSRFMIVTVRNVAGTEMSIEIEKDALVYELQNKIIGLRTNSGFPFVEGTRSQLKLFIQPIHNTNEPEVMSPVAPLSMYIHNSNDVIMAVMKEPRFNSPIQGGRKHSRRISRHKHTTRSKHRIRGKKSRKHSY